MSKSATSKSTSAHADSVKVSSKTTSFDLGTTNSVKFSQKNFYLRTTFTNVSLTKNRGYYSTPPPQAMKCQNGAKNADLIWGITKGILKETSETRKIPKALPELKNRNYREKCTIIHLLQPIECQVVRSDHYFDPRGRKKSSAKM